MNVIFDTLVFPTFFVDVTGEPQHFRMEPADITDKLLDLLLLRIADLEQIEI